MCDKIILARYSNLEEKKKIQQETMGRMERKEKFEEEEEEEAGVVTSYSFIETELK